MTHSSIVVRFRARVAAAPCAAREWPPRR